MRRLAHLDDTECITLARRGDRQAFSALVARHQDRIHRFLLRLTHSAEDALDLTQDTFLRAFQHLDQWRPEARFTTWLFQIARNLAIDRLRRDARVAFVAWPDDLQLADPAAGPEAALETAQRYRQLEAALARLPREHREILLLREIEGLSYDDLGTVLDLHPGTVKSRLARARAALLEKMQHRLEPLP